MTSSTKISLAVVALLLVVLVVYYGSLPAEDAPQVVSDDSTPTETQPESEASEPEEQPARQPRSSSSNETSRRLSQPARDTSARTSPPSTDTSGRMLGDSVDRALTSSDRPGLASQPSLTGDQPSRLPDREPVVIIGPQATDGGKDAPVFVGPPRPEDLGEPDVTSQPTAQPESSPEAQPRPTRTAPAPRPRTPQPPAYTEYTIKASDTLSSIAAEWFGDEMKWDLIAKANPLVDPNRLRVGQVLRLPPKDTAREEIAERAGSTQTVYIVRSGDSLSRIARSYYNDESRWRMIYDANRGVIGDSPNNLRVGMRLVIPPAPAPAG